MGMKVTSYGDPMHIIDIVVFTQIFVLLVTEYGVVDLERLPFMGSLWKKNTKYL
jgi:hypothetical protein